MLLYNQAVLTIYPFSFHMQLYRYCLFQRGTTGLQQPIVMERFSYMTVYSMGASLQASRNSLSAYTSLPFVTTSWWLLSFHFNSRKELLTSAYLALPLLTTLLRMMTCHTCHSTSWKCANTSSNALRRTSLPLFPQATMMSQETPGGTYLCTSIAHVGCLRVMIPDWSSVRPVNRGFTLNVLDWRGLLQILGYVKTVVESS